MIEKIKTVNWEVRSHGHKTTISEEGIVEGAFCLGKGVGWDKNISKTIVKKLIWHLQDVLKCMKRIEKEKELKNNEHKQR